MIVFRTPTLVRALFAFTLSSFAIACAAGQTAPQLQTYPAPEGAALNRDFTVKARTPAGEWQDVSVYLVKVDLVAGTQHVFNDASMAYFDFTGAVEISITHHRGSIEAARIRPLAHGVKPEVKGNTITFSLTQPRNLSIEVNGDIAHNLHLYACPIEPAPDRADPNVVYFGPGIHPLPRGGLRVTSGQTVYLAGGAIVRGHIACTNVENVRIRGRGYFDQSRNPITVVSSKNVEIDGLMVSRSINVAQCEGVTLRNLKTISHGSWGDGLDIYCSKDVLIDGVFLRTSDDCVAIYAHRNRWSGDVKNVTVQNATLWADVAHPILVGTHGNTANPESIEDLTFRNIDILDHCEAQVNYQGCLSLNASDSNLIRNVRFEDIRIDDFRLGQLVNLRVAFNRKYATSAGRGIENVYFKNITYTGTRANLSVIAGYDDTRKIKNVVFENLVINGKLISDKMVKPSWFQTSDMANFFVGEHVEGLAFIGPGEQPPAPPPPVAK